jgi:PKD repeat protein
MMPSLRVLPRLLLFLLIWINGEVSAQNYTGTFTQVSHPNLLKSLDEWEVYQLDVAPLNNYLKSSPNASAILDLQLGLRHWKVDLTPNPLLAGGFKLQVLGENGLETSDFTEILAFQGTEMLGGGSARLTIDDSFLSGYVTEGDKMYYIEPLRFYDPAATPDMFVLYERGKVRRDHGGSCGVLDMEEELDHLHQKIEADKNEGAPESMACYTLDLAIASDRSMFNKYGSVGGVITHNVAVINDVQGDYTGNFNHDINFNIVTQFVVTGTDPWTTSTDAGTLLSSFRTWGNAGNFGVGFDVGELWTNRDFNGGTIGIAYLNGVCNTNKYHCLQDFSTNSELLRCLTSHELGHNFSMTHDPTSGSCPPNFIMCPFVSTSSTWSSNSQSQFNAFVQPLINNGCLVLCGPPPPPLVANFSWDPDPGCPGQPITMQNESTGNITSYSWTFQGTTPTTSNQQNPVRTWANAGTYNVTLTVNGTGGPVSVVKQVVIKPLPVASFTFSVSGTTVTFNNTSTNGTTYSWDFGDGQFSLDEDPVHTYDVGGLYIVVLTAVNECGTSTKTIQVNTAPTAAFSADPTSGCATLTVQYTNESSSNASTFLWSFPGGTPSSSNLQNPVVLYSSSGVYNATLTVGNAVGSNTLTKTAYISVQNVPSSSFNFNINNNTVAFTNTSINATSYAWNFGDGGTSAAASPTHTYAAGGTYTVTLSSTNACGTTTSTQTVTIISTAPPTAAFTANTTSGCAPLTVQFTNGSTGAASYDWQFPGGNPATSNQPNPSVVFATAGTYTVTLTASNANGTATATQTITVNAGPTASFTTAVSGASATFTNTSTNATTYTWLFPDGSSTTTTNASYLFPSDGVYSVTLTSSNNCGTATAVQSVVIVTPPAAAFTASATSGCAPLTVQFNNTSSANAVTYNWSIPGGNPATSSQQNPTVVFDNAGTYTVTLTVGNTAGTSTATQTITVNNGPTAGFTQSSVNLTVSFVNTSGNASSYSWDFGNGSSSAFSDPIFTYLAAGTYTVVLTSTNGCGTATSSQVVTVPATPQASFTQSGTSGCAPFTVQFNSTASANSTSILWDFPGGSPTTSTANSPTVVYATPGTYTVTLTASNSFGSSTATQTITVGAPTSAGFSAASNGATATFTNGSANATSYSWDFGDNISSNEANPSHTYTADGTYTVVLTASGPCGTNTASQTITIATPPTAAFSAQNTTGCAPLAVQFTNTSSANAGTFEWSFPGGIPASSTAQNPTVTYEVAGIYTVSLTVSNAVGSNTAVQSNLVVVSTTPAANFSATVSGYTANLANNSTNAIAYSWDFGDGNSSSDANPSHTYAADGTYTVVLTASNNCGSTTYSQNVVIANSPNAGFNATTTSGCGPLTVQFNDLSSGNATSWAWTFPGGTPSTSNQQNPVVVYESSGVYDVTLVATSAGGSSTFTQPNFIQVFANPTADFSTVTNGYTVNFTNLSQNATTYVWNFGDGSNSGQQDPNHTYAMNGTYTVTLTATNNCGTVTTTQTVNIAIAPVAAFAAGPATSGCIPMTVQFTDQSQNNPTAWNWFFEGGTPATSNLQNPVVTYNTPGVYGVQLEVSNAGGANTTTSNSLITVEGLPTAGFTFLSAGGEVKFTNTSTNGTSFTWNFGDGSPVSNEQNPQHSYTATGSYTVELTVLNNCGATTIQQTVSVEVTGTTLPNWLETFRVYPNPNNGVFMVEMQGQASSSVEFTLFNTIGQQVHHSEYDFRSGSLQKQIRLTDLPAAMYTLRVRQGDKVTFVKLAVQK